MVNYLGKCLIEAVSYKKRISKVTCRYLQVTGPILEWDCTGMLPAQRYPLELRRGADDKLPGCSESQV